MRYHLVRKMDISNGPGVRVSVFMQGCEFHCKNCFNPETWCFDGGQEFTDEKIDEVMKWNDPIVLELTEHSKEGGIAYNIEVSGEIENGKTTLRYEGFIIKKDGKRIDYKKEKTFDFVLCSEKRFFTNKL